MGHTLDTSSHFADVGDISTVANPEIIDQIREQVQGEKRARSQNLPELSEKGRGDREVRYRFGVVRCA